MSATTPAHMQRRWAMRATKHDGSRVLIPAMQLKRFAREDAARMIRENRYLSVTVIDGWEELPEDKTFSLLSVAAVTVREMTNDDAVTNEEATAVVEWCRLWLDDLSPERIHPVARDWRKMATPVLLRVCNSNIEGGILFVLTDVRAVQTTDNPARGHSIRMADDGDAIFGRTDDGWEDPRALA